MRLDVGVAHGAADRHGASHARIARLALVFAAACLLASASTVSAQTPDEAQGASAPEAASAGPDDLDAYEDDAAALDAELAAEAAGEGAADEAAAEAATEVDPHSDPHKDVENLRVTGRKREEYLQEVPVSIRAFDAAEIDARNITRIDEIGFGTANLTFDATNGSNRDSRIYIRGIGQDDPRNIVDPAVGLYIDNVYIPRATNALIDVVDFERIEVLRGPQGTLYGKNTVGGVINVVTKKPGTELGGYVDVNVGTFSLLETRAAIDLPVRAGWFDDKLFTRWGIATATEDGYTTNVVNGEDAGDNSLLSLRGSARLLPVDGLIVDLVADWQRQGERSVIGKCVPANPFTLTRYVTDNFLGEPGNRFTEACQESIALGPFAGFAQPLEKTTTDTVGTSLQMDYAFPEASTSFADFLHVKSITGFRQRWDDSSGADLDATPLFFAGAEPSDIDHWAISQDLNLNVGFWDERIDLIVGGFFLQEEGNEVATGAVLREMATGNDPEFNAETFPNTVQVLNEEVAPVFGLPPQPQFTWFLLGLANDPFGVGDTTGDTFWQNAVRWGIGEFNAVRAQQWQNRAYAAYAHMDVEVIRDVTLQGGIRYTDESKVRQGQDQRVFFSAVNATVPPFTITPPINPPGTGTPRVVLPQTVDFTDWTPEAGAKWQITDEHMTYFRYARGWKSGGLRVAALTEEEAQRRQAMFLEPYLPEEVDTYEVGAKTQWFENQLLMNATLFWNDYRNLQVTSLEPDERGIVSALIRNAEDSVTRGFELEGSYVPDWAEEIPLDGSTIVVTGGVGFTDAFYQVFSGTEAPPVTDVTGCPDLVRGRSAQCDLVVDRFVLGTLVTATGLVPPPAPLPTDLSPNQFKNTPRLNTNASLTYSFLPMAELEFALRLDWSYRSTIYYTTINDPNLASGPLHLLNLSAAFDILPTDSQVVLWVKNATDEVTVSGALNLGEALGADGVFYSQPRTFGARFVQRF